MDEIKVRLSKVTKQLEDMQAAQQSLAAQQATDKAAAAGPGRRLLRPTSSTTTLCAITTAARMIWPSRNFRITEVLSQHRSGRKLLLLPGRDPVPAGNYQQAAQSYDQVMQNFPSGNKAASAQLKKGFPSSNSASRMMG